MARELYVFAVVVPAGTAKATPQTTNLTMPPRNVSRIEFQVPPGPRGELGWYLGSGGAQALPLPVGTWIVTDDERNYWDLEGQTSSGQWQAVAYNTGSYQHTFYLRFLCDLTSSRTRQAGQAPIPASDLAGSSGGGAILPLPLPAPLALPGA